MTIQDQAEVCYIVLSRTYQEIAQQGRIVSIDDRTWGYQDESHTLGYDPQSDCLWISNRDGSHRMEWREGAWVNPAEAIPAEFLRDIKDLDARLDALETPTQVSLRDAQLQAQTYAELALFNEPSIQSIQSAARLFEQYAEAGEAAYQVEGSTAHHYRVSVGNQTYIASRDDSTNRYRLTREDGLWTDEDDAAWRNVGQWVTDYNQEREKMRDQEIVTYWEQQQGWSEQMLPVALHLAQGELEQNGIQSAQWGIFRMVLDRQQETIEISYQNVPLFQAEQCGSEPKITLTGHLTSDRWREFLPILTWNQLTERQQALQQEWSRAVSTPDRPDRSNAPERD